MERLLKCFKFQLRNMTIKMLIYTCFYVVVYLLICIMF
jgi:hypothetical protein